MYPTYISKKSKASTKSYIGHHLFDKPRTVWYEAKSDVLIDFGEDDLWKLLRYEQWSFMSEKN
jgi:hypothetical protein